MGAKHHKDQYLKQSYKYIFSLFQVKGNKISTIFGSKEVSADIWSSKTLSTYQPCHSEIHCAGLVKSNPRLTACLFHKETKTCKLGYIDEDVADQPNPVKVKFRLSVHINGEQGTMFCPTTHPYSFLNGKKCCDKNLEVNFLNKVTGSRGLLLHNSTACGFKSVFCPAGWLCTVNSPYKNRLQMPDVNIAVRSGYATPTLGLDDCQARCEEDPACKAWVVFKGNTICHLKNGDDSEIVINLDGRLIAGFKSTYINVPLE